MAEKAATQKKPRKTTKKVAKDAVKAVGELDLAPDQVVLADPGEATLDNGLTPAQEMFCQLYAGSREFFNNATRAYMTAYEYEEIEVPHVTVPAPAKVWITEPLATDPETMRERHVWPEWYQEELDAHHAAENAAKRQEAVAATLASRLLRKVEIRDRCDEVLREKLTDTDVDTELAWMVKQRKDLGVKLRATAEYNRLKGRITNKLRLSGAVGDGALTEDEQKEIDAIIERNSQ